MSLAERLAHEMLDWDRDRHREIAIAQTVLAFIYVRFHFTSAFCYIYEPICALSFYTRLH